MVWECFHQTPRAFVREETQRNVRVANSTLSSDDTARTTHPHAESRPGPVTQFALKDFVLALPGCQWSIVQVQLVEICVRKRMLLRVRLGFPNDTDVVRVSDNARRHSSERSRARTSSRNPQRPQALHHHQKPGNGEAGIGRKDGGIDFYSSRNAEVTRPPTLNERRRPGQGVSYGDGWRRHAGEHGQVSGDERRAYSEGGLTHSRRMVKRGPGQYWSQSSRSV